MPPPQTQCRKPYAPFAYGSDAPLAAVSTLRPHEQTTCCNVAVRTFSLGRISCLLPEPTAPFPIYETLPPEFSALTRRLPDFSTSAHCLQNRSKNIPHFCCYDNIDIDKRRLFKVEWFHSKKELRFSYDTNCQGERCGSINCFAVPDCAKMI